MRLLSLLVALLQFSRVLAESDGGGTAPDTCNDPRSKTSSVPEHEQDDGGSGSVSVSVIIVGAGASGLSAAQTLRKSAAIDRTSTRDYLILEASDVLGGRTRKDTTFTDFPIDLGASFMTDAIVGKVRHFAGSGVIDGYHFVDYTWHDFIADHVAPQPSTRKNDILYGCQVVRIDYAGERVQTICKDGRAFDSKYAIVTVPLQILKDGDIRFNPPIPEKITSQHPSEAWAGFKVFIEFSEQFFPEVFCLADLQGSEGECMNRLGENAFWRVSSYHTQTKHKNILAGYVLGSGSEPYLDMDEEEIVKEAILKRLDMVYDGKATKHYLKHKLVNWSKDPYTRFTLSEMLYAQEEEWGPCVVDKIVFAGEAFNNGDSGWVHSAINSGENAAKYILQLFEY